MKDVGYSSCVPRTLLPTFLKRILVLAYNKENLHYVTSGKIIPSFIFNMQGIELKHLARVLLKYCAVQS